MYIFPAIDLYDGKAVRLYKGDYARMTVYSDDPVFVAKDFQKAGATRMHLVDLEAAKSGVPENAETIRAIAENTDLFLEVGGGIRTMQTLEAVQLGDRKLKAVWVDRELSSGKLEWKEIRCGKVVLQPGEYQLKITAANRTAGLFSKGKEVTFNFDDFKLYLKESISATK